MFKKQSLFILSLGLVILIMGVLNQSDKSAISEPIPRVESDSVKRIERSDIAPSFTKKLETPPPVLLDTDIESNTDTLVEATSICVINYMRENAIELLGRKTLVADPEFILIEYDFDRNIRFFTYISRTFKQGLLDSMVRPLVIDQIYSSLIPGQLLKWSEINYNLTTAISSDKLNTLPPGLVEKINSRIALCLALPAMNAKTNN